MAWNKEKIETTLNELQRRILTIKEEPLLSSLKQDYKTLLEVIKIIDVSAYEYYRNLYSPAEITYYNDAFKIESARTFFDNGKKLSTLARKCEENNLRTKNFSLFKKIPLNIQIEMAKEFFSTFDQDHYLLLEKMLDSNIYFSNNKDEIPDALGKCYHISSLSESFIIVDSRRGKNVSTLPHELAHAFEFNLIPNFYHQMNWYFSSFVECYPRFIEFLFLDYFMDGEYKTILAESKRELFDCLKIVFENYYSILYDAQEYNPFTHQMIDGKGNKCYKKNIDYIIGDLLAIYMLNLYKNNRDAYEKFMLSYHSFKGISDKEIWALFDVEDLEKAFVQESVVLRRNLSSRKK